MDSTLYDRMRAAGAADLVQMEQEVRHDGWTINGPVGVGWQTLSPGSLPRIEGCGTDALVTGLLSWHPNGYVREEAVSALSRMRSGGELTFLLLRLDDWVAEVREVARLSVHVRLAQDSAEAWARAVPILLRLSGRKRLLDQPLIERALNRLRAEIDLRELPAGLGDHDALARRWWAEAVLDSAAGADDLVQVATELLGRKDTMIRALAARLLASDGLLDRDPNFLARLAQDRSTVIRRIAAEGLCRLSSAPGEVVSRLLMDPSADIRRMAAFPLAPAVGIDPATFYRGRVEAGDPHRLTVALAGLADTGRPSDADLASRFWNDSRPGVQRAAVRAVSRLIPDEDPVRFLEKLSSPLPGVSREARKAIEPRLSRIALSDLSSVFESSTLAHVRINALALLASSGKWRSVPHLVRALSPAYGEDANLRAQDQLGRWWSFYNRVFTTPSGDDLHALEAAIRAHSGPLRDSLERDFGPVIREWGRRIGR